MTFADVEIKRNVSTCAFKLLNIFSKNMVYVAFAFFLFERTQFPKNKINEDLTIARLNLQSTRLSE